MDVGVNYPWVDYGWDFGQAPPTWRAAGAEPGWRARIDQHLARFRALGISVVRWFLMGDGLTYGSGSDAPQLVATPSGTMEWRFNPPALSNEFQAHFELLLDRFHAANQSRGPRISLIPVLVDFKLFEPGSWHVQAQSSDPSSQPDTGWVKGGRADVVNDATKRTAFLANALAPLLRISNSSNPRLIYAWEIVNEPEWITNDWHPQTPRGHPVDAAAMRAFLDDAKAMIRRFGFKSTIGFARLQTIANTHVFADVNQFHHYTDGTLSLDRHPFNPQYPGIIGEFATSSANDTWPELRSTSQRVLNRLRVADRQGYPLALAWSALPLVSRGNTDRHTLWDPQVEHDIECFTNGTNCTP